jgi:hypothetical protein
MKKIVTIIMMMFLVSSCGFNIWKDWVNINSWEDKVEISEDWADINIWENIIKIWEDWIEADIDEEDIWKIIWWVKEWIEEMQNDAEKVEKILAELIKGEWDIFDKLDSKLENLDDFDKIQLKLKEYLLWYDKLYTEKISWNLFSDEVESSLLMYQENLEKLKNNIENINSKNKNISLWITKTKIKSLSKKFDNLWAKVYIWLAVEKIKDELTTIDLDTVKLEIENSLNDLQNDIGMLNEYIIWKDEEEQDNEESEENDKDDFWEDDDWD